jgi:hypothetical protein
MADKELKSSLDLAMERLRRQDAEAGVETKLVTEAQKAAIAEVRNFYDAKLAQQDVMHRSALMRTFDPAEQAVIDDAYRRERERLTSERDAKIEKIRGGQDG